MGSIGARTIAEVGLATENGRFYYVISSLLKHARIPYIDVILDEQPFNGNSDAVRDTALPRDQAAKSLKLIITTRRERLQVTGNQVICIEDLGEDLGVAKQKLFSILNPPKETDRFVVGIDPGERTGFVAFMNQIEVDSAVLPSIEETIVRAQKLLDNAPNVKKIVKIGAGAPRLAKEIARSLGSLYRQEQIRIQLVDERGTSSLYSNGGKERHARFFGTRDQRSAKLIAFREGRDYPANLIDNEAIAGPRLLS